jgi:hypothetical protein
MSGHVGPDIPENNLVFYIDGKNQKSFFDNTLKSLLSNEQKTVNVISDNGYLYSDFKSFDKFEQIDLSDKNSFTVNVLLDHKPNSYGFAFSINSNNLISFLSTGLTTYNTSTINTIATSIVNESNIYFTTGTTIYTTSIANTFATNVINESNVYSNTDLTTYNTSSINTLATNVINESNVYSNTDLTTYNTSLITTLTSIVNSFILETDYEISVFANPSGIVAINNNGQYKSQTTGAAQKQGKSQYTVIFRKYESNVTPITVYVNGDFYSNSLPIVVDTPTNFENLGINLFNKSNSNYSTYGIRSISLYDRELSPSEVRLINRVEPIK